MCCMRALTCDEFFEVFAENNYELFCQKHHDIIKYMTPPAAEYWTTHKEKMRHFLLSGVAHWAVSVYDRIPFLFFFFLFNLFFFLLNFHDKRDIDSDNDE